MKPRHVRILRQVYVGTVRHAFFKLPEQHRAVLIATGSSRRKRSRLCPETLQDIDVPHVGKAKKFLAVPFSVMSTLVTMIVMTRRGSEV